jgi:hypothetical protein
MTAISPVTFQLSVHTMDLWPVRLCICKHLCNLINQQIQAFVLHHGQQE